MHKIVVLLIVIIIFLSGCTQSVSSNDSINNDALGTVMSEYVNDDLIYEATYKTLSSDSTHTMYEISINVINNTSNDIDSHIYDINISDGDNTFYAKDPSSEVITDTTIKANSSKTFVINVNMLNDETPTNIIIFDNVGSVITEVSVTKGEN